MEPSQPRNDSSVGRRTAVKQLATAGAIAWTAPIVLSSKVAAQSDECTPKCIPRAGGLGTRVATGACSGSGIFRRIPLIVTLPTSAPTCPCSNNSAATLGTTTAGSSVGTATIAGNVVTVAITGSLPSNGVVTVTVTTPASCQDRDDSTCAVTCTTTIVANVSSSNNGNCTGLVASLNSESTSCP